MSSVGQQELPSSERVICKGGDSGVFRGLVREVERRGRVQPATDESGEGCERSLAGHR